MISNRLDIAKKEFGDCTVLIAGAGGTIGSELVHRIAAKTIIAIDISEYAIYKLQRGIEDKNIHCVVGDISDRKFVNMIFKKYSVDYVFNAAAYKHVDTLEDENNTYSVVKNNILSTINLCEQTFKGLIHISSDKAVNPTNNMGYTKLWCERIVQEYSNNSAAMFKIVRFGNVYNSAGSFVETLQWQLDTGKPITITDERMKRYFMTSSDAVGLIVDIVDFDERCGTYILDMGEEVSIVDLINTLNVNNSPVKKIGIRPGEKLREELVYKDEELRNTNNSLIKKVDFKHVNMYNNINLILSELNNQDDICIQRLNDIIITTTIL